MLQVNAIFSRKESSFDTRPCVVEKVIRLSGAEYDRFASDMLQDQDFIKDNNNLMRPGDDGQPHCLLVVGEGRRDGVLVDSCGHDYARYSAFVPNVEGLLTVEQYPALAALNQRLTDIVDHIAGQTGGRTVVDLQNLDTQFGIDLMTNGALRGVVLDMLGQKPEITDWELDKNELILYREPDSAELTAEDISDFDVTLTDMYAYGYCRDGMIPLGQNRALELFDEGHQIYRLYIRNFEKVVNDIHNIEMFTGMFGVKNPAWDKQARPASLEAFIINRERYEKGKAVGEWLTLPADANALRGLFERIGVYKPSEGAFSVTAIRVPYDCMQDYVTKYDSLDEINMLASYMKGMEDYELDKLQAILTSGVRGIGSGTAALINLLDADNFDAFNLIAAKDAGELGRYWEEDKPDEVSFEEYGKQIAEEEKGVFIDGGYIYFRHKELSPEYTGAVPDEYRIVGEALRGLRPKTPERTAPDRAPSVLEQIRAAQKAPRQPSNKAAHKKDKGGPEL